MSNENKALNLCEQLARAVKAGSDDEILHLTAKLRDVGESELRIKENATKRLVDMSALAGTGIDCEFKFYGSSLWTVSKLKEAYAYNYKADNDYLYDLCRPRFNHPNSLDLWKDANSMLKCFDKLREAGFKVTKTEHSLMITGLQDDFSLRG